MTYQETVAWSQKRQRLLRQWRVEYLQRLETARDHYLDTTLGMAEDDPGQQAAWKRYCTESNTIRQEYLVHGYEDGGSMSLISP